MNSTVAHQGSPSEEKPGVFRGRLALRRRLRVVRRAARTSLNRGPKGRLRLSQVLDRSLHSSQVRDRSFSSSRVLGRSLSSSQVLDHSLSSSRTNRVGMLSPPGRERQGGTPDRHRH